MFMNYRSKRLFINYYMKHAVCKILILKIVEMHKFTLICAARVVIILSLTSVLATVTFFITPFNHSAPVHPKRASSRARTVSLSHTQLRKSALGLPSLRRTLQSSLAQDQITYTYAYIINYPLLTHLRCSPQLWTSLPSSYYYTTHDVLHNSEHPYPTISSTTLNILTSRFPPQLWTSLSHDVLHNSEHSYLTSSSKTLNILTPRYPPQLWTSLPSSHYYTPHDVLHSSEHPYLTMSSFHSIYNCFFFLSLPPLTSRPKALRQLVSQCLAIPMEQLPSCS